MHAQYTCAKIKKVRSVDFIFPQVSVIWPENVKFTHPGYIPVINFG